MPKSAASSSTTAIHAVRLYGGYPMASTLSSFPRLDCQLSGNCATPHCRPLDPAPSPDERRCYERRTTADCATVRGNIANVRAAQGRRARQGRESVAISAPMLMSAPPSSRRASTTPGLIHRHTRYRLHELRRYLASLFAPTHASRLLPPRQLTVRALFATPSASPPIANVGFADKKRCSRKSQFPRAEILTFTAAI